MKCVCWAGLDGPAFFYYICKSKKLEEFLGRPG